MSIKDDELMRISHIGDVPPADDVDVFRDYELSDEERAAHGLDDLSHDDWGWDDCLLPEERDDGGLLWEDRVLSNGIEPGDPGAY